MRKRDIVTLILISVYLVIMYWDVILASGAFLILLIAGLGILAKIFLIAIIFMLFCA
jgi:hypothetical protein